MVTEQPKRSPSLLARILGWVLGAASLLNLVQDLGRMAVLGKLKIWLDAYSVFVHQATQFLFGWLDEGAFRQRG